MWAPQDMARAERDAKIKNLTPSQRGHRDQRGSAFLAGVTYGLPRAVETLLPGTRVEVRNVDPGPALDAFDRWEESEGR